MKAHSMTQPESTAPAPRRPRAAPRRNGAAPVPAGTSEARATRKKLETFVAETSSEDAQAVRALAPICWPHTPAVKWPSRTGCRA
jgi:hypothetical protein